MDLVAAVVKLVQEDEEGLEDLSVLGAEGGLDEAEDVVHRSVERKAPVLHQRLVQLRQKLVCSLLLLLLLLLVLLLLGLRLLHLLLLLLLLLQCPAHLLSSPPVHYQSRSLSTRARANSCVQSTKERTKTRTKQTLLTE